METQRHRARRLRRAKQKAKEYRAHRNGKSRGGKDE